MIHRLHPLKALLSATAMFFLFTTSMFSQQNCTCNNSIDFDLDNGSNVPILMDCAIDIDITPSADQALKGEWFPDNVAIMPSSDDPACFAAGLTIVDIQITRILMIAPTFQQLPTGNFINNLTAGDELTIDFEVTLSSGECSGQQYSLDIVDNSPPVIDCPVDISVECISDLPAVPNVTFMDNCFVGLQPANYEGQSFQGQLGALPNQCTGGTVVRTWKAVDMFGFVDTCRQSIFISADTDAPTFAALPNLGPFCVLGDAPIYGSVFDIQNVTGADIMDCTPDNSLSYMMNEDVLISGTPTSCPRTYRRSYTLTDDCGNVQTYGQDIIIDDPTGPTIITQPQPVVDNCTDNTATNIGFAAWVAAGGNANVQEDCGAGVTTRAFLNGVDITANPNASLIQPCPNGDYIVTFEYTNACGVSTMSNPTNYMIDDRTTPTITDGADAIAVDCGAGSFVAELQAWVNSGAQSAAVDACSGITLTSSLDNGVTTASFTDILNELNNSINNGLCQDNFPLEDGNPFTVDNAIGFVEVTFTYTDACGNPTTPVTKRFTVTDNDPPVITQMGGNLSISCSAGGPTTSPEQALTNWLTGAAGGATTDGCQASSFNGTVINGGVATGTQVLTNGMIVFGGGSILDILSDGCGITGDVTVRFQATDDCGNLSMDTYDATFSLTDNDAPVILSQPENIVVNCNLNEAGTLAAWVASRGDNPVTGQPGATASDACGNTSSYFFITGTYDPNLDPDGNPSNNPGFNSITLADLSDECGPTGVLSMTVFFVDECGNTSQTSPATFRVIDDTPPTVTQGPMNATAICDGTGGSNTAFQNWLNNAAGTIASDNCSATSFTFSPNNPTLVGACGATGGYTVEFFATDECGLSVSAGTAMFTIVDNAPPAATSFPEELVVECGTNNATQLNQWAVSRGDDPSTPQPGLVAADNCSGNNVNTFYFIAGTYNPATDADNNPSNNPGFNTVGINDVMGSPCNAGRVVTVDFFAADECGNVAGPFPASFRITKTMGPIITMQPSNGSVSCTGANGNELQNFIDINGGATAADACGTMIVWTTIPANPVLSPVCGSTGSVDIIFVATDECGFSTQTNSVTYSVTDNDPPVIMTQPEALLVNCNDDEAAALAAWTATRGNDPNTPQPGATATDNCGTSTSYFFISGTYDPNLDPDGNPSNDPGFNSITLADLSNGCGATGELSMTVFFVDECGNTSQTGPATFRVEDNTPPTVTQTAMDASATCDGTGGSDTAFQNWLNSAGGATAFDNCGNTNFTFSPSNPVLNAACGSTGFYTVEFFAQDECGISTSAGTATFTIVDNNPPTATSFPEAYTVECGSENANQLNLWAVTRGNNPDTPQPGFEAMDNCSGNSVNTFYFLQGTYNPATDTDNNPSNNAGFNTVSINDLMGSPCMAGQTVTLDFFAADLCGNVAGPFPATFSVTKTTGPVINTQPTNGLIACTGANGMDLQNYIANNGGAMASDACGTNIVWTTIPANPVLTSGCGSTGAVDIIFVATDECGFSTQTNQVTFEVFDITDPLLDGSTDISEECGPGGNFVNDQMGLQLWIDSNGDNDLTDIDATDNCSEPITFSFFWTDINGNTGGTGMPVFYPTVDASSCGWRVDVTFVATDACNNESRNTSFWEITDGDAPEFTSNLFTIQVTADADCNFDDSIVPFPSVFDACSGSGSLVGTGTGSVIVTFNDVTTPVVPCDNNVFQRVTRTYTATDQCGNESQAAQLIEIRDFMPPTFSIPPNVTVNCNDSLDPAFTGGGITDAEDNCSGFDVDFSDSMPNGCAGTGVITRTWTLTDGCGNANTQQQFITVVDNDAPVVTIGADDLEFSCSANPSGSGVNAAFANWIESIGFGAVANDNCSSINNAGGAYNPVTGQIGTSSWFAFQSGTSTPAFLPGAICPTDIIAMVDFVVRDECGNSAFTSATFSVIDNTPPVISGCPTDITITTSSDGLGDCAAVYEFSPPTVVDGCADIQSPCGPIGFTSSGPVTNGFIGLTGAVDPNVLVDAISIDFTVPSQPTVAVTDVEFSLSFRNFDGEFINVGHTEFFRVFGEGMTLLGQTMPTDTQCGDLEQTFTIPVNTYNQWASDGVVSFNLIPNDPGPGLENQGINNTCMGSSVAPSLIYDCSTPPAGGSLEYSVNGGPLMPATFPTISEAFFGPSSGFTGSPGTGSGSMTGSGTMTGTGTGTVVGTGMAFSGVSTVTFVATDCSGNATSCTFNVTVIDDEAPMFANCPLDNLPATITTPDCNPVDVELPRPDNDVVDNCELSAYDNTIMFNELRFTAHPNIDGFVMDTVMSSFSLAGSPPPSGDGVLNIMFKGDLDNTPLGGVTSQETLNVFGEGGVLLGTTGTNAGCGDPMMNVLQVTVPAALLQAWSADGNIDITVAPVFNGLLGFNNDGDPSNDDFGINPCVDPGTFTSDVTLTNVTDSGASMLSVQLSFESTMFGYNVSGATTIAQTMFPSNGSNPVVSLNPGMNTITYTVSDFAGNVDNTSCVRTIDVTNPNLPNPMISANATTFMCPGETVVLTDNSGYTSTTAAWKWYIDNAPLGTNGPEDILLATTAVPTLAFPALSGSTNYHSIICENLCTTDPSNVVNISTDIIANSPIIVANPNPVCEGDDFLLTVTNPDPSWTSYRWEGPNGFMFMGQFPPAVPDASIFDEGLFSLFVIDGSGCEIPGSIFVDVVEIPEVPFISSNSPVCDGEPIILTTSAACDKYTWIGPDGSSSGTLTNPLLCTTTNTTTIPAGNTAYDQGLWSVICSTGAVCDSESSQIEVLISDPIPVAPFIVGGQVCGGEAIQLDVNDIDNAITYNWVGPNMFTSSIRNPIVTDAGLYTLVVTDNNGCTGVGSIDVQPSLTPTITAISFDPGPGGCVTGAENLQFMVSVFPLETATNQYTYQWTGPNGFMSIVRNAMVPNVTQDDNGEYVLVVTGPNGCSSDPFPIQVNVIDAPVTPIITIDSDMICEGEQIRIESTPYSQPGVLYVWDVPGAMDTVTNVPTLIIDPATAADAGSYSLTVDVSGCVSNASGTITVDVTAKPDQPVIVGPIMACAGENVILTITDPNPNADYMWTGPANFNATSMPVTIFDVEDVNQGEYRVVCILNGCESDISDSFVLDVQDSPATPSIISDGPICLDDAAPELTLSIVTGTGVAGATYEWFDDVNGGNSLGTTGLTPFLVLNDFSNYATLGDNFVVNFTVVANVNGCTSALPVAATVAFNTIPNEVAFAGDDQNICNQSSIFLNGLQPSIGEGMWTQQGGPPATIINPQDENSAVSGLEEGSYIFRWSLSNGGCTNYSFDDVVIVINSENQIADGGGPYGLCNVTEFNLDAIAPITGNSGVWTQPTAQEVVGITIVDPTDPNSLVTGLEPNNTYSFTWCLGNQGCGPDFDCDEVQVVVALATSEAFAGQDFTDCGDDIMLNAIEQDECQGSWSAADPNSNVIFTNPGDPNSGVINLSPGANELVWTLDCNECGITSSTVVLTWEPGADAVDDFFSSEFGQVTTIDVTLNDALPPGFSIEILDGPTLGTLEDLGDGMYTYVSNAFSDDFDEFTYEVCSDVCPDVCATAVASVRVLADDECVAPTIFTPNGDGYNDEFVISCLFEASKFPDNEVIIYNQWGDEVFNESPYNNDWMGTYNGDPLPVGTYFYIINFNDGGVTAPLSGFLVLER